MYKLKELALIALFLMLAACSNVDDNKASIDGLVEATSIAKAVVNMEKLTIDVQKSNYDTTAKLLGDVVKMLHSVDAMNESVINTIDLSMKLANTLAQPAGITENYKSIFTIENNYTSVLPAFAVKSTLTKNYFLLSSQTPFFLEKKTVKSYFTNSVGLAEVWVKALAVADKSKNLYLSIVEIDGENVTHKVSNAFLIKSADFPLLI